MIYELKIEFVIGDFKDLIGILSSKIKNKKRLSSQRHHLWLLLYPYRPPLIVYHRHRHLQVRMADDIIYHCRPLCFATTQQAYLQNQISLSNLGKR